MNNKAFRLASDPGHFVSVAHGRVHVCTLSDGTESASVSVELGEAALTRKHAMLDLADKLREMADSLVKEAAIVKVR